MDGAIVGINPTCEWTQKVESGNDLLNYTWKYHLDGSGIGILFSNPICNQSATGENWKEYICSAIIPVNLPGQHNIYIITTNTVGIESASSEPSPTTPFYIQTSGLDAPNSVLIKKQDK